MVACFAWLVVTRPAAAEPPAHNPFTDPSGEPLAPHELDPTQAFGERVILLVRTPGDDGVMTRLSADLRESGWRILEIRPDERFDPGPLGKSAEHERASAAVRIDAVRGVVELWVQRPEGPVEETITVADEPSSEQVLALSVAEALRARGLLLSPPASPDERTQRPIDESRPASVADTPGPSRAERRPMAPAPVWFALGPGLTLSPGGLGPQAVVAIGVHFELTGAWSLRLDGLVPVSRQRVAATEGEAEVATWLAGGALELAWAELEFGGCRSGIGAAATVTTMSGESQSSDFDDSHDSVTAFAPFASTSFHVDLGRAFRLRANALLGATFPEAHVAFGSRTVASWGRPFFVTTLAFETSPFAW